MPNSYKLTVKNKTGAPQHYSFFSAIPVVSGGMSGDIWSNVLKACPSTPNDGKAMLEVWDNYYAVCGSYDGVPNQGMRVSVSKSTPVSLGYKNSGNVVMGSSLALKVIDKRACDFGPPTNPGAGKIGNFQITTAGDEFTFQDATDNHLMVGIANSKDGDIFAAMGTFTPYPTSKYQIQPQNVFYVASGEKFDVGQLVKVERIGSTMAVDFNARGTNQVTIIHNESMGFEFA